MALKTKIKLQLVDFTGNWALLLWKELGLIWHALVAECGKLKKP